MRRVVTAIAVVIVSGLSGIVAAHANDGGQFDYEVKPGPPVTKSYDGMATNDPGAAFSSDVDSCYELPWCTVVVLHAAFPADWDPEVNQFVLKTTVSWDDRPILQGQGGQYTSANDIDVYAYKKEVDEEGTATYTAVGQSASARQPEVLKVFGPPPTNPDVYLVVYNYAGPNLGFDVTLEFKDTSIEDLPEYGGAATGRSGSSTPGDEAASSPTPRFTPSYVPSTPSGLPSSAPVFVGGSTATAAPALGADTFSTSFGDTKSADDDLAGTSDPNALDLLANSRRTVGPPKPVPGVLLFFWLGVVPAVLFAGAVGWLIRRRPTALTLAVSPA